MAAVKQNGRSIRFIEELTEKDRDYEAFSQYMYDNKDEVYELLEDWSDGNEMEYST